MKYLFEILDSDLEDRKKIIQMKESLLDKIEELTEFGQNTMRVSLERVKDNLEWCENEWLRCQREKAVNRLSEILNIDRDRLGEKYWDEND